jgi:hypothetical protein
VARTVNAAFSEFMRQCVNLTSSTVSTARNSRDWLIQQIHSFPEADSALPRVYAEIDIQFGSFARRTKIRPLDDIDIMLGLHGEGGSYSGHLENIEISVRPTADRLMKLCDNETTRLNSRKVINKFVTQLEQIPQYEHAEIKRNQEAATLKLKSYDWTFDIVPCFFTVPDGAGRTYYLIPDGLGRWKMTDPRLDRHRVIKVDKQHGGSSLPAVRIMKYWNRHRKITTLPSYLLENMLIDYYETADRTGSDYVDLESIYCLGYVRDHVVGPVRDPKNLQGDLNNIGVVERMNISQKAGEDFRRSVEALELEKAGEHQRSIARWREVFGDEFPKYE